MNLVVMSDGSERIAYPDPAVPIYVCRGDLVSLPDMSALCHWHEDVEFLLPLEGSLSYNVNGTRIRIQEGNAIFVNTRQLHHGFSSDGTDCRYICVTFRPQLLCASEELRSRYVLPVLTGPNLPFLVLRRMNPEHRPLLNAIHKLDALYREGEPGLEMQAVGILYGLWTGLYRLVRENVAEAVSADVNVLIQKQMLDFIRTHYQERITVDAIAAAGGVCRTKCCQIFRKFLDCTPNDYLNSFRLEKGMELLRSTGLTVTEIADRCGYSSASYFTEMFTRHKGCSPKVYRKGGQN